MPIIDCRLPAVRLLPLCPARSCTYRRYDPQPSPMRVALIQSTWTPHTVARLPAAQLRFEQAGLQLDVVTITDWQRDYDWGAVDVPSGFPMLFTSRDYWSIPYVELRKPLLEMLQRLRPDIVVLPGWSFRESFAALGWSLREEAGRVLISDSHATSARRRALREIVKRVLVTNYHSAFVAGSPHIAYLANLGFSSLRCFTGCDAVDNDFFSSVSRRRDETGSPTLLSTVRLVPQKNLFFVLDALKSDPHGWRWLIAGDGPERRALEQHTSAAALGDRVRFLGHIAHRELPGFYSQGDVYLQPSLAEPWGLAINEAMAAGLPVLASNRCGASPDLVTQQVGVTFEPTRQSDFLSALELMWSKRAKWSQMGAAARSVVADWGLDRYARGLMSACRCASLYKDRPTSTIERTLGRIL